MNGGDFGKSLLIDVLLIASSGFDYDSKLPIVLFVGQHFSGSLFEWVHLSILTRERTKETRARELGAPSPYLLGSLPRGSLFPYSHLHSAWGVG